METGAGLLFLALGLFFYFLPALNGWERKHRSAAAIFAANLFLGWTILGWIFCLIWSYSGNRRLPEPGAPTPETHVKCPECRELVLHDARKCKHCGCARIPRYPTAEPVDRLRAVFFRVRCIDLLTVICLGFYTSINAPPEPPR